MTTRASKSVGAMGATLRATVGRRTVLKGAAAAGAVRVAERIPEGVEAHIVFIVSDGGWKYLSTGAWTGDIEAVAARADEIVYF